MVKKVVRPARSSVVNLAPLISLGCGRQLCPGYMVDKTYVTRSLEMEVPAHNGP